MTGCCPRCRTQKADDAEEEPDSHVRRSPGVVYAVDDVPQWYHAILLALQYVIVTVGTTALVTSLLARHLCIQDNYRAQVDIINTSLFVAGLTTVIQTSVGIRLPVIEGGASSALAPVLGFLSHDRWPCPGDASDVWPDAPYGNLTNVNVSPDLWKMKLRELQGGLVVGSLFLLLLGVSGLLGLLTRLFSPMTVSVIITLTSLSQFHYVSTWCATGWWTAIVTWVFFLALALYTTSASCCSCWNKCSLPIVIRRNVGLYSVALAAIIGWTFAAILTGAGGVTSDTTSQLYQGRVDAKAELLNEAPWFRFPYPFQWGWPTCGLRSAFTMIAVTLTGSISSIGDYYACAKLSGAQAPPQYAINRGVVGLSIGAFLQGVWGTGRAHGVFSDTVGVTALTKVGSRRVTLIAGITLLIISIFGKVGALVACIPTPVSGGILVTTLAMMTAVGVSHLQYLDLNMARNLFISGLAIISGISISQWARNNGHVMLGPAGMHDLFYGLLNSAALVGGSVCLLLDNTVPGDAECRGMEAWRKNTESGVNCYDLPVCHDILSQWKWTRFLPFCSTFTTYPCQKRGDNDGNGHVRNEDILTRWRTASVATIETQI